MTLKMSELREKDTGSLQQLEKELQENLFAAKLQKRTGQLENLAKIALTKRDLARVKTVLRARELGLEVIETGAPVEEKKAKKSVTHDGKTEPTKAAPKKGAKPSKVKTKAKAAKPAKKKTKAAAKPAKKAAKGGRK